jgi:hypothetical protein
MQKVTHKLTFFVLSLVTSLTLSAQKASVANTEQFIKKGGTQVSIQLDKTDDLTEMIFFIDNENKLLFIDFEALGENLQEIRVVIDADIVYTENVTNLPMNTIYEVDLKKYREGIEHRILLKTDFGILTKSFIINN